MINDFMESDDVGVFNSRHLQFVIPYNTKNYIITKSPVLLNCY